MAKDHREIKKHIQTQKVTAVEEQGPLWPISNTWISSHVLSCNLLHTAQTSRPHSHAHRVYVCSHVTAAPIPKAPADGHVHEKHRFSIKRLSITRISIGQIVVHALVNLIKCEVIPKQTGRNQKTEMSPDVWMTPLSRSLSENPLNPLYFPGRMPNPNTKNKHRGGGRANSHRTLP